MPDYTRIDLVVGCRRLFLRGWHPANIDPLAQKHFVNVEIWVRYLHSSAASDELCDVLDYNVMRDALLAAGTPDSQAFIECALDELMRSPIEVARVEIIDDAVGVKFRGVRYKDDSNHGD
ncbi:hypothetical protein M3I53_29005 [Paraburkholderia sp. CNPSo 3272]|uniref:hypothetical protein n=1 Tax=Paraburkholderia sp. CNPSo 3272 TaxID=2940931 RepID=UPI0020B7271B|nr:hypothetical protein [Paraburkholderia sp. CNPSo 3272]MCP3727115.1 hypothetical protein [Paraburkholderia sp. CNPSo 3272]